MSSSTSSSDPARRRTAFRGWRAAGLLVLVPLALMLVALELGMRFVEPTLSLDIRHIQQVPAIATSMRGAGEPRILFLGNSLTRNGVDLDLLGAGLEVTGTSRPSLHAIYPDDTTVLDWLYILESSIVRAGAAPEMIVIGFANHHLVDTPVRPVQTYRLGRYFTDWQDLPRLFRYDVTDLDDRVSVVLSKLSAAFANRERLSARVLDLLPGHRASARHVNDVLGGGTQGAENGGDSDLHATATVPTYDRMTRLVQLANSAGSRLLFVAMPVRDEYELPGGLVEAVVGAGGQLIDLRDVEGLTREHFLDSLHLSPNGAEIYSAALVNALRPLLPGPIAAR